MLPYLFIMELMMNQFHLNGVLLSENSWIIPAWMVESHQVV